MGYVSDGIFSEDIIEGVITILKGADQELHTGGLPANFFVDGQDMNEVPLKTLQHGDLSDFPNDEIDKFLPAIFVRSLGNVPKYEHSGLGVPAIEEYIRVIFMRRLDQCRNADGNQFTNFTKARSYYAKILHKALFNDPHRSLATINAQGTRTKITLTTDENAQVYDMNYLGIDYGFDINDEYGTDDIRSIRAMPTKYIAFAIDIAVNYHYGGAT